jgi:hypothetical protein
MYAGGGRTVEGIWNVTELATDGRSLLNECAREWSPRGDTMSAVSECVCRCMAGRVSILLLPSLKSCTEAEGAYPSENSCTGCRNVEMSICRAKESPAGVAEGTKSNAPSRLQTSSNAVQPSSSRSIHHHTYSGCEEAARDSRRARTRGETTSMGPCALSFRGSTRA